MKIFERRFVLSVLFLTSLITFACKNSANLKAQTEETVTPEESDDPETKPLEINEASPFAPPTLRPSIPCAL